MKDARPDEPEENGGPYAPETILRIYGQIRKACLFAGLSAPDAEDVAQEIWLFLLAGGSKVAVQAAPWIRCVAQNFIKRYWRRKSLSRRREGASLEELEEARSADCSRVGTEENDLLRRLEEALPALERRILTLVRSGHTVWEAGAILGIPAGSRTHFGVRLVRCARRLLKARQLRLTASPAASLAALRTPPRT